MSRKYVRLPICLPSRSYLQLLNYKDDLGNPPLLIVSDLDRIEIRTNFTGLSPVLKVITLDEPMTVCKV